MKAAGTIFLTTLALFLVLAGGVKAHEGRIVLKNESVACEGISIWRDSNYRITGRCSGLVYPYQERVSQYVLWAIPDGETEPKRIDNIEVGMFDGQFSKTFSKVFITPEGDSSPRQPSEIVIASGDLQPFNFDSVVTPLRPVAPVLQTPSPTPIVTAATIGTNLRKLLVTVAIVGAVLGIVVVGLVILSRRS